jgi:glycosyltransferase involved in cell wall biosynthesis
MREALGCRLSEFDVAHISRIASVPCLGAPECWRPHGPLRVLDLDELESAVRRRELEAGFHVTRRSRWLAHIELRRLQAFERRMLPRFDLVLVCSETERARVPLNDVSVVSNGIELPNEPPAAGGGDGRTVLFVGFMDYPPNADAARFLASDILPLIRREVPEARAVLVGRTSSEAVLQLHDGETIVVRGEAPDLRPYYENASVVVAPLRVGGGTRIKILEAFAWRRPVVTTRVGAEGLRISPGNDLFVEDTPDGFAARCVALLKDPSLRVAMARRALSVAERYQWSSIRTGFARIIEQRVRDGGRVVRAAPGKAQ